MVKACSLKAGKETAMLRLHSDNWYLVKGEKR